MHAIRKQEFQSTGQALVVRLTLFFSNHERSERLKTCKLLCVFSEQSYAVTLVL